MGAREKSHVATVPDELSNSVSPMAASLSQCFVLGRATPGAQKSRSEKATCSALPQRRNHGAVRARLNSARLAAGSLRCVPACSNLDFTGIFLYWFQAGSSPLIPRHFDRAGVPPTPTSMWPPWHRPLERLRSGATPPVLLVWRTWRCAASSATACASICFV